MPNAQQAYTIVSHLQKYFVQKLNALANKDFEPVEWFRDEGKHGGGVRYEARDENLFNRASVNISQVHYDDMPDKALGSASAISTIIHPKNPLAPSMHMHISWTELKNGKGYWRIMADLNPSIIHESDKEVFIKTLKEMAPDHAKEAIAQGDRYFFIPALDRHRGVAHFYLENFNTDDKKADEALAQSCGERVIESYIDILKKYDNQSPSEADKATQLAYHTLYLFQVLTLDRGTTSGLLVHDQNDVGILGSLPSHVDKALLQSWMEKMPSPQEKLLESIIAHLPEKTIMIDETIKARLAQVVRRHYQTYPEALNLQASGDSTPPTVENHK
jgi:coproporphyrinogen III oxidase